MASNDEHAASERGRHWIAIAGDATAFVLTLLASVAAMIMLSEVEPTFRGFFCDDRAIAFPALPSTVPVWALAVACLTVPLTTLLIGTFYQRFVLQKESNLVTGCSLRQCHFGWLARFVWYAMWMLIGLGLTLVVTNVLKLSRGELRPNFLDLCDPDFTTFNCTDENNLPVYVTNYTCRGEPSLVREARQSWPSGHASLSTYSFTFTALYVLSLPILYPRSTVQLMVAGTSLLLAIECGISRITDNKHHASDVIWGTVIGAFIAVVIVFYNLRFLTISGPGGTPVKDPGYHQPCSRKGRVKSDEDTTDEA